jgi:lipoprotein-releasing system ATP-binding protein
MSDPLLVIDGVVKRYDGPDGDVPVLDGLSLSLAAGESAAIVGPSGSGKTTLLHVAGALDRPTSGRVLVAGQDTGALSDEARAALRRRELGFVFQEHHLLPQLTALENVLLPTIAGPGERTTREDDARARRLLDRVGLGARSAHRPGQLSGGERQRVAVARALVRGPRLLLADEPTGSLDRAAAESLGALLVELNREEGLALLLATHSEPLAARMGRVLSLDGGRLREAARRP